MPLCFFTTEKPEYARKPKWFLHGNYSDGYAESLVVDDGHAISNKNSNQVYRCDYPVLTAASGGKHEWVLRAEGSNNTFSGFVGDFQGWNDDLSALNWHSLQEAAGQELNFRNKPIQNSETKINFSNHFQHYLIIFKYVGGHGEICPIY